ncbi:MAG: sulfotransferase domain-containing protein [Planctomycetota bacterium]|nr:sulfotransferase domain-containing protein [Planctomycetota bacterium]
MRRSSAFPWTYIESRIAGSRGRHLFDQLKTYVMFIGQPRSGTSLLGSILNAHRRMCVAQELNALRYVRRGYNRWQLFWLLMQRDATFAKGGRQWTGYDYVVPNQWQGKSEELQVIGDKKAGLSTDQLRRRPKLMDTLQNTVGLPIRIVHVVRDPFNVITTVHRRRKISMEKSAQIYFRRCETNWQLMQQCGESVMTFELEELISQPESHLRSLCSFLGVDAPDDYISDCAGILFAKPKQTKTQTEWSTELIGRVQREAAKFPFLRNYRFGDERLVAAAA